jgi:hypothetical protein
MQAPTYQAPPEDPTVTALKAKAQADDMTALQNTAGIDTASLMARYGTRLAMAGATQGSPLTVVPPPVFGSR